MADTKREIERKYESDDAALPDLTRVRGVASVRDRGVTHLDATYHDTADLRLAASSVTLRRRTGRRRRRLAPQVPRRPGVRDEIRAPLSDTLPDELAALIRSRVRDRDVRPVVRLRSDRDVRHLLDDQDRLLAEVSVDTVHAERLTGEGGEARWTEIEVELADDGDPDFLDKVEKRLKKAGVRPSASASKLARALAETEPASAPAAGSSARESAPGTPPPRPPRPPPAQAPPPPRRHPRHRCGDHVLAYVRAQRDALVELDPAVRQDVPDAVHRMRVATRRLRSTFRSFRSVLDRTVTDPVSADLKWLATELGADRDQEVLAERLTQALGRLPADQVTGPVAERLATWSEARHKGAPPPAPRRPRLPPPPPPARHPRRPARRPAPAQEGRRPPGQGARQGRRQGLRQAE